MIKQPRKRLLNACDECRKRKVRCDSATITGDICSECVKWKTKCTHNVPNKRRGPKVGSSRRSSAHKSNLRQIVSSIVDSVDSYTLPEDLGFVRSLVIDLALQVQSLETRLKQALNSTRPESLSSTSSILHECGVLAIDVADSNADDTDALALQFEEILTVDGTRHYGGSSTFQLLRNALNIKGEISGGEFQPSIKVNKLERPGLWSVPKWQAPFPSHQTSYVFPEDDLMHDLIELYFTNVDPYFPMLHRPTLERSLLDGVHTTDRRFGALILMICSLASQHSNDPRTLSEGTESEYSKGWKYFRQIQLMHHFEDAPSIHEFQIYPLASLYLHTTNVSSLAFFLVAIGIRSAHQKGVHERHFVVSDNPIETELWRRAFWCLIIFDIYASVTLGRPRVTLPENVDADYPQDFQMGLREKAKDNQTGTFPTTKPSLLSFWIYYIKLFEIVGLANQAFYSVNNSVKTSALWNRLGIPSTEWAQKALIELDAALNKWVDSIPSHLRWDPQTQSEILLRQSSMLYATYYWAQFQVHKPFLSRSSQFEVGPMFPSVTICANSARSLIGLLETHHRQLPFVALPLLIGPLFDSAIVLLINLWRGLRNLVALDPSKELGDVRRCISLLGMYENRYQAAGRLCDTLNSVISVNLPVTRSLKRSRTLADGSPAQDSDFERYLPRNGTGSSQIRSSSGADPALDPVVQFERLDLPYHSHELSKSPLQMPSAPVSTSANTPYPDINPFGGTVETSCASSETSRPDEDWQSFMTEIDHLLQSAQTNFADNLSSFHT
ncbi:fungal-specific transcription factor domain-containing protein [Lentinula aff. detonsa]|uniref:Fungal-specific transcription factor domain-containing protein n=1 Tax=Lentinula aff. detonsa TaxID=2804958 RepID=A0AA38NDG2_9AGAR|nr:fungal-specific transcription factor domain-containing protein [Lentinula aff. detonsa]